MKRLLERIREILRNRHNRRAWARIISAIACLVVFFSTYALILPAITMEKNAYCGIEAHQHDDSCYSEELICTIPESEGHTHDDSCYTTHDELSCQLEEHVHGEGCYDEEGNLICELIEHEHDSSCWQEVTELTCGLEESEGHHHTDACYEKVLTCGKEAHTHSEACYKLNGPEAAGTAATDARGVVIGGDNSGKPADDKTAEVDVSTVGETDSNAATDSAAVGLTTGAAADPDTYVPTLGELDFNRILNRNTGIYYYHVETAEDAAENQGGAENIGEENKNQGNDQAGEQAKSHPEEINSADIPADAWQKVNKKTVLGENDILRVYFSYTIPAGSLNETNDIARYRLPANLHINDDQIKAINKTENGIAAAFIDYDTLAITDADAYHKYLGVEAVEGTRRPGEIPAEDVQEYISAVVRVENIYDTEGLYGKKDALLGQDLVFTFVPYTVQTNQNTYDAQGDPTSAGETVKGWFTMDLTIDQIDFQPTSSADSSSDSLDLTSGTREAEIVFVEKYEDPAQGIEIDEISTKLVLKDKVEKDQHDDSEDADDPEDTDNSDNSEQAENADDADNSEPVGEADVSDESDKEASAEDDTDSSGSDEANYPAQSFQDSITVRMGSLSTDTNATNTKNAENIAKAGEDVASAALPDIQDRTELTVNVEAEEGTFPEGTTMHLASVTGSDLDTVAEAVEGAVESRTAGFHAVDITFHDADGNEIEPRKPIKVSMQSESIRQAVENPSTAPVVVHVEDNKKENTTGTEKESENSSEADRKSEITAETDSSYSSSSNIGLDGATVTGTTVPGSTDADNLTFEADSFSVYAVVYTVDFHYEVNGKMYEFSIPGGGFVSFEHVVEVLGISEQGTQRNSEGENAAEINEIEAGNGENTDGNAVYNVVEEAGVEDTGTYSDAISLNSVEVSEATKQFVADVASVEFSSPELVWVGKVDGTTTVGGLKEANGLEVEYSAELTEEQIAEINSSTVEAGDWALISVLPFTSEESLTVTMMNGDQFVVRVTDAYEIIDLSAVDPNTSCLIGTKVGNEYHLLKTDGTQVVVNRSQFDKLDASYQWTFYYVFTEKDRETSLDYTYYFIRPVSDKTKTIALNDPTASDNPLVQTGTNNVAVIPHGDGFVFLGYNHTEDKHIELGFDTNTNSFIAYNDAKYLDPADDPTVISLFAMEPLPTYEFTVVSDDYKMGSVNTTGTQLQKQAEVEQRQADGSYKVVTGNVNYYLAETNNEKTNKTAITAVPASHTNTQGQNKWEFDYWDLDGTKLAGYEATIASGTLEIPSNGSVLTAHFKQKSESQYIVPDREKDGSSIEHLSTWLEELKSRNIPLNDSGCKKTAEVYDYENRIYRVDLTAQSSLTTFNGTIDLGFVLDVSSSMNFPSYLYESGDVSGAKSLTTINNKDGWWDNTTAGVDWGLNTGKTYYIIADPSGTATVCYLYYYNGSWWLCDASKDRFNFSGNGPFYPDTGHSYDNSQYYNDSYYSLTQPFVIMEAGDRVTDADFQDGDSAAILRKLGLNIGDPKSRAFYLEKSLNGTLKELDEILDVLAIANDATKQPDVKIAWNTFKNFLPEGNGSNQYSFVSASNGISLNYDKNTYGGGTSTDIALLDAAGRKRSDVKDGKDGAGNVTDAAPHSSTSNVYRGWYRTQEQYNSGVTYSNYSNQNNGFQWEQSATKYAVLITDGAPQRSGNSVYRGFVDDAAQQLKNRDVDLITVGLGIDNVTSGKILLYDIADSLNNQKMFYSAKSGDELEDVLLNIIKQIMVDATVQGDVTDTIHEAFYPVDRETGRPLAKDTMITLDGVVTTDASSPHGTITYDESSDQYGVVWTTQDFTWEGWHGSVFVKAKEDLLGGNAVTTNSGNAVIEAKAYKTSENGPSVELVDKKYTDAAQTIEDPKYNRFAYRESPKVNINELSFAGNDTEWNVYLGTQVDPKLQLEKLFEEMLVLETVTKGKDIDGDTYRIPDMITDDGNLYYFKEQKDGSTERVFVPSPDSIVDNREYEDEADEIANKQKFRLADLIRELLDQPENAELKARYITQNGMNWDNLFTDALRANGITIPYHVYGISDGSNINIKLRKEILTDEEDDLINESPHATTVVNGTGDDVPVEKYSLTAVYSPDYNVLPKGQGGASTADFHVGTYGTIYQGHAAGTETSSNTHLINVYAEPLDVLKKDDHGENVPGAVFKLYRAVKQGETGEPLSSYDDTLTGSYYCISTATSGADGIAHLAPDDTTTSAHTIPVAAGQTAQNLLVPLEAGETYYLVEESAPAGYKKDTTVRTVTVEIGPEFYTKLDKTTAVEEANIDGDTKRPTIAYNWDEGVTFIVKDLGSDSTENQATLVNHDTREAITLTDAGGADRTYMLRSDSDQSAVTQVIIVNNVVVDIKIQKTDLDGEGLAGAVFQMKAVNGLGESEVEGVTGIGNVSKTIDGETRTFTSAFETTGGEQTFSDLPDGTYRLYEAYVPAGYISTFRYIQFTIENRVMKDVTTDSGTSDKVVYTVATGNSLALLTIKNNPGAALPNTGGPGTTLLYLLGILLTGLAGAGLVMSMEKRRRAA